MQAGRASLDHLRCLLPQISEAKEEILCIRWINRTLAPTVYHRSSLHAHDSNPGHGKDPKTGRKTSVLTYCLTKGQLKVRSRCRRKRSASWPAAGAGAGDGAGKAADPGDLLFVVPLLLFSRPASADPIVLLFTFICSEVSPGVSPDANFSSKIRRRNQSGIHICLVDLKNPNFFFQNQEKRINCKQIGSRENVRRLTRCGKIGLCWCWPRDEGWGNDGEQSPEGKDQDVCPGRHPCVVFERDYLDLATAPLCSATQFEEDWGRGDRLNGR